jgi:hypothetical protein
MTRHRLEVLVSIRDGVDRAHLLGSSPAAIARFWEEMGYLVRRGHLDRKLMWNSGPGPDCELWWVTLAPWVRRLREESGPRFFENFEWYAGINTELNRRAASSPIDEAWIADHLHILITQAQSALRFEQVLRAVVVASPEAPARPSPAPAPVEGAAVRD